MQIAEEALKQARLPRAMPEDVPHNGHTVNPSGLVKVFVDAVVKAGGRLVKAEAGGFAFDGDRLFAIETSSGRIEADTAVLAPARIPGHLRLRLATRSRWKQSGAIM